MDPKIEAYLREHGATYTNEALRKQLIAAGHDAAEVDAALRETEATRAPQLSEARTRRSRFRWLALAMHAAALVVVTVWVLQGRNAPYVGFVAVFMAVALLIGLGISARIGRSMLGRGMGVALLVPAISAILLGGTCMAMAGGPVTQPRSGTMELEILAPRGFTGSGVARCDVFDGAAGFSVSSESVGTLDGRSVAVFLDSSRPGGDPSAPIAAPTLNLNVSLSPGADETRSEAYITIFSTRLEVDVSADRWSGTIQFHDLAPEPIDRPPGEAIPDPISGTVGWNCGSEGSQ